MENLLWNVWPTQYLQTEYSLEGLMLKLWYFGHLMQRANSLEKTLMLGKIEGKRRRGWQKMRWWDGITNLMEVSSSKLWDRVDRGVWGAAGQGATKSWTRQPPRDPRREAGRDWIWPKPWGSKATSISVFSCFICAVLFIRSFIYPSLLRSLRPPGTVRHCDWELGEADISWFLELGPATCLCLGYWVAALIFSES